MKYEVILVMDEDDTPVGSCFKLTDLLDDLYLRLEEKNLTPEDVLIRISSVYYEDENSDSIGMGEVEFLVKIDG